MIPRATLLSAAAARTFATQRPAGKRLKGAVSLDHVSRAFYLPLFFFSQSKLCVNKIVSNSNF